MGIINFAHGELYMLGAFMLWWLYGQHGLAFPVAVAITAIAIGGLGIGLERGIFRPLRRQPMMALLASIGLAFALQVALLLAFGTIPKVVPAAFPALIEAAGFAISMQRISIIVVSVLLLILLGVFLQRTKPGLAIFACAEDPVAASLQGISLNTSSAITMGLGCGLAGVAGALAAPIVIIEPYMGVSVILKAFMIVIIGGAGSIRGALVMGFVLGFLESGFSTMVDPVLMVLIELVIMLVVLVVRPEGLFK